MSHTPFPTTPKCLRHSLLQPGWVFLTCYRADQSWMLHRWLRRWKPLWRGPRACWMPVCLWDCWRAERTVSRPSSPWIFVRLSLYVPDRCGLLCPLLARQKLGYVNAALAQRFLLSGAPRSLRGYVQHCDQLIWPLFSHLEAAVREGTNQHEKAFGRKANDLFQVTQIASENERKMLLKIL